jgi:predicted RNA-binding Zn ribbon-like protein
MSREQGGYEGSLWHVAPDLCLTFANTVEWRAGGRPVEGLPSYERLVDWSRDHGLIKEGEAERLMGAAGRRATEAHEALASAIELRETIYRIFSRTAHGQDPTGADFKRLDRGFRTAMSNLRLGRESSGHYRFDWDSPAGLDWLVWPIACSAAELLVSDTAHRVRECANVPCGWLFIDRSRSGTRRWCDMSICGNRIKARRHYARQKARKR